MKILFSLLLLGSSYSFAQTTSGAGGNAVTPNSFDTCYLESGLLIGWRSKGFNVEEVTLARQTSNTLQDEEALISLARNYKNSGVCPHVQPMPKNLCRSTHERSATGEISKVWYCDTYCSTKNRKIDKFADEACSLN